MKQLILEDESAAVSPPQCLFETHAVRREGANASGASA